MNAHLISFKNYCLLLVLFFCVTITSEKINDGPIAQEELENDFLQAYMSHIRSCATCACASGCFLPGAAAFCNVNTNNICITNNAQVGGDLTVCGNFFASGIISTDYLFAYRAVTQTLGVVAPTFADIIFTDSPTLSGWIHLPSTSEFICPSTSNYLIEYNATCRVTNSQLTEISIIAVLNGAEIPGSQSTVQQPNNNKPLSLSRSFIAAIDKNDVLKLQFTGGTSFVQLEANSGNSSILIPPNGVQPSITLTITRVT